jgi:ribonuclease-3
MDNQYLEKLFEKFQIKPNNYSIYLEAFTHSSYKNDNHLDYSYERLEFLGDAIIQKIVTEHLYKKHLEMNEGDMSKARNIIVQSGTLVRAAKELLFENIILVGNSLSKNDNKITDNILEDSFEAFIGAVFLDQNEKKCYQILKRTIIHYFEINALNEFKD